MSERSSSPVPPRVVVSGPMKESTPSGNESGPRKRTAAPLSASKEHNKNSSVWVDIDDERPRRRRKSRQHPSDSTRADRQAKTKHQSNAQSDLGRFFPRLSRILEATDPNIRQKSSIHGPGHERDIDGKTRDRRHRDDTDHTYRHSAKRRSTSIQRRHEPFLKANPSMLSVRSGLTSASSRSSGSNSTITQKSYDRKKGYAARPSASRANTEKPTTIAESMTNKMSPKKSPNVFDFMENTPDANDHEGMPVISPASSVSSHYQPSDAGSSEAPPTPSSRSTLPSPTAARSVSVAELRRKYDPSYAGPASSHGTSSSLETSTRNVRRERGSTMVEQDNDRSNAASPPVAPSAPDFNESHRQSSHGSLRALDDNQRLQQQEEELRRHMAYSQHPYAYDFTPSPEPPHPAQTTSQDAATDQSLQHYIHQPIPTRMTPPKVIRPVPSPPPVPHPSLSIPPQAPEAPDVSRTTLTGYELLATHLSPPASSNIATTTNKTGPQDTTHLTPLYRKFTTLHHRVLLHLQDELSDLELQLRTLDEIVAQTHSQPSHHQASPPQYQQASRRAESHPANPPIFAHRTRLLGQIFLKQQQYHAALRDYSSTEATSRPAKQSEVDAYRSFLEEAGKPIWEGEVAFLGRGEDLVVPGASKEVVGEGVVGNGAVSGGGRARGGADAGSGGGDRAGAGRDDVWEQTAFLGTLLVLPLLLSLLLPEFATRAAATALLGIGAGLVVWGSRVRGRER